MNLNQITIDWDVARRSNRDNWEDRVPLHEESYRISDQDDPNHSLMIYLVRFTRKQRDDYWRERGKDPKHPEL